MWALGIGVLVVGVVLVGGGCSEDKCKNPKMTTGKVGRSFAEGPAVQCNAVLTCEHKMRPPTVEVLKGLEDPVVVEQGSDTKNRCIEKLRDAERIKPYKDCTAELSLAPICLDVDAAAGGPGPAPTGETFVAVGVGVGAGSGDSWLDVQGAGGAGSAGAHPGDGGHGGI